MLILDIVLSMIVIGSSSLSLASESSHDPASVDALHDAAPPGASSDTAAPVAGHDAPSAVATLVTPEPVASHVSVVPEPELKSNDYLDACRQRNMKLSEVMVWYFVVYVVLCIVFGLSTALLPIVLRSRGMSAEDVSTYITLYKSIIIGLSCITMAIVYVFLYLYVMGTFLIYMPFPMNILCPMFITPLHTTGSHNKLLVVLFLFHLYFDLSPGYMCLWYAYIMVSGFIYFAYGLTWRHTLSKYVRIKRP